MPVSGTWSCVLASDLTGSQSWSCPLAMGSVLFLVSCLAFWSCVLVQKLFLCSGLIPGPVSCFCSRVLIWSWSWVLAPSPAYWIPYTCILFPALPVKSHPLTLLLLLAAGQSYWGCLCSCALSSSSSTHPSTKMDVSPFSSFVYVDSWVLLLYHVCSPQLICVEKKILAIWFFTTWGFSLWKERISLCLFISALQSSHSAKAACCPEWWPSWSKLEPGS